jgi:hypothetical protein
MIASLWLPGALPAEYSYFAYWWTINHFQLIGCHESSFHRRWLCRSRSIYEGLCTLREQHALALHQAARRMPMNEKSIASVAEPIPSLLAFSHIRSGH